jgi:peptidoglycan hydrolase-like protein with peptidoglycan-binding domain
MSSTVSPEQAAGPGVAPPGGHRRGRRRWVTVVVVVLVVIAAAIAAVAVSGLVKPASSGTGANQYKTSTQTVTRQTLVSQINLNATLGDSGSYTVSNQGTGTITWLPAVGHVVRRGKQVYGLDGTPVVLLYGNVPSYRTLSEGMIGPDVRELNQNLIALGYATRAELLPLRDFSANTAYALERYQTALGITSPTGSLTLGQAVFLPTAAKITAWGTGVALGAAVTPGEALMTATSATPVATISLDPSQEGELKLGDHVGVTLPDGTTTPGVISAIGKVATTNASGVTSVPVTVSLTHPRAAHGLSQAPVTVKVTTGKVNNVLVVPVDALQARSGGGYAVEVVGPHGHHLVRVTVGIFDTAAGLVQVSGSGLAAGQRVVVPAL